MDAADFAQSFGFAGCERTQAGVALRTGRYCIVIPQEDVSITSIALSPNFTYTDYNGQTLAKGIPWYCPFTTITLTGKADVYRTAHDWANHDRLQ